MPAAGARQAFEVVMVAAMGTKRGFGFVCWQSENQWGDAGKLRRLEKLQQV